MFHKKAHVIPQPLTLELSLSLDIIPWDVPHKHNIRYYNKQVSVEITKFGLHHSNIYKEFRTIELVNIRKTGYICLSSERKAVR